MPFLLTTSSSTIGFKDNPIKEPNSKRINRKYLTRFICDINDRRRLYMYVFRYDRYQYMHFYIDVI